jgi:hypothetical protein
MKARVIPIKKVFAGPTCKECAFIYTPEEDYNTERPNVAKTSYCWFLPPVSGIASNGDIISIRPVIEPTDKSCGFFRGAQ